MSATFIPEESEIVQLLTDHGLSRASAVLAVAMVTREHSRPEQELVDIVRQYQGLESNDAAGTAIRDLKQRSWIVEFTSYGLTLVKQADDLREKIATFVDKKSVARSLTRIRSAVDPCVQVLGSMNDERVYQSYLDLLRTAHTEICLPMLATTPKLTSVPILQERAKNGVKVKILLAAPKVVAKLRSGTSEAAARESIEGWKANARQSPNIELRLVHVVADAYMSTCMTIDGNLLRLDVYDPHTQRSLQGTMVEFRNPDGRDLNVMRIFRHRFEEAWARARPIGGKQVLWWFQRFWQWWMFAAFVVLAWSLGGIAAAVCISAAASFLTAGIVESRSVIRDFLAELVS